MPERSPTNGGSRHRSLADLLKAVQDERPLYDQELRAWCLLLGRRGLSCRLIARALGTSKSTVQRHLAAGQAGIDLHALIRERLSRADDEQGTPLAGLSPREQLRELDRRARGFGLYRRITEPEEKLFA
jgi:transposase